MCVCVCVQRETGSTHHSAAEAVLTMLSDVHTLDRDVVPMPRQDEDGDAAFAQVLDLVRSLHTVALLGRNENKHSCPLHLYRSYEHTR